MADSEDIQSRNFIPASIRKAICTLRSQILLRLDGSTQTFLVTSARAGEGKTTISLSLSALLAASMQRVLLIDANLRTPSLARILGLSHARFGLSDLLLGAVPLRDACQILGNNFVCVPAGSVQSDPQPLLINGALERLLKEARSLFDVIIMDSSCVLESIDPALIAAKADGVIVVVGCGNVKQEEVRAVPQHLRSAGANVIGAVLNRARGRQQLLLPGATNLRIGEIPKKETSAIVPMVKMASTGAPPK